MTADVSIGQNLRYELKDALLVYRCGGGYSSSNRGDYITLHEVITGPGAPTLGPAKPLTTAFIDDLCRNIGKRTSLRAIGIGSFGGSRRRPRQCSSKKATIQT